MDSDSCSVRRTLSKMTIHNSIAGLASNTGFDFHGNTEIFIKSFTGAADADSVVRAAFVAEMSEVFMDYRNQSTKVPTWIHGNSMGEALSAVCAALLHPDDYYTATVNGPSLTKINDWLNASPRPNWITKNDPKDTNFVSFGCGIVFIYYLLFERAYPISDVITKAGPTLELTYESLTGSTGGWTQFIGLLSRFLPEGTSYHPVSDNLFPHPRITVRLPVSMSQVH